MNLSIKLAAIRDALYNVPYVGDVYDQQHADTHMSAALLLVEVEKDTRKLMASLKQMLETFDPHSPTRKQAIVWDRATALITKLEGGAK